MAFTCFLSYSRSDRDQSLNKFVKDLRSELSRRMGVREKDALFFDTASLEQGDEWNPILRDALATSQVLVTLCSPNYLRCDFCGREYQIFLNRRELAMKKKADSKWSVILPVVWIQAEPLPKSISDFQYTPEGIPEVYTADGLHQMMKSGKYKDYHKFLNVLVKRIKAAAEHNLAVLENVPTMDSIANAFTLPTLPVTSPESSACNASPPRSDTHNLRENLAPYKVVGRTTQLEKLKALWNKPEGYVVVVRGPAGAGKTALARAFLDILKKRPRKMPRADKVFAWSFLNQGQEDFESTATGFVREALKHFGYLQDSVRPFSDLARALR